jgi:hypothetical protein
MERVAHGGILAAFQEWVWFGWASLCPNYPLPAAMMKKSAAASGLPAIAQGVRATVKGPARTRTGIL